MKKMLKWILLVVIVLSVLIGGAAWGITASGHRVNVNQMSVAKLEDKTVKLSPGLNELSIKVRTAVVQIKQGSALSLKTENAVTGEYEIHQTGEKLTLTQSHANDHQLEFGRSATITITVPKKLANIHVEQLNGTLRMENVTVGTLMINHLNGTTLMDSVTIVHDGTLTKKNGTTDLKQMTLPGLKMELTNGQGKLNGKKVAGNAKVYSDNQADQLVIKSGNGQVSVTTK